MKRWIAFWNIFVKDFRAYYLKPPNISWGLIFPLCLDRNVFHQIRGRDRMCCRWCRG